MSREEEVDRVRRILGLVSDDSSSEAGDDLPTTVGSRARSFTNHLSRSVQARRPQVELATKPLAAHQRRFTQPGQSDASTKKSVIKKQSLSKPVAQRRLPVNDLVLVQSPVEDHQHRPAQPSSPVSIEVADPIHDLTSSPCKADSAPQVPRRTVAGHAQAEADNTKSSLTKIRKKLKARHSRFKVLKRVEGSGSVASEHRVGDGFNDLDRTVPVRAHRRLRTTSFTPVFSTFRALNISAGPLPEVQFVAAEKGSNLEIESDDRQPVHGANPEPASAPLPVSTGLPALAEQLPAAERAPTQQDEFVREGAPGITSSVANRTRLIAAQLASISAPARRPSNTTEASVEVGDADGHSHWDDEVRTEADEDDTIMNAEESNTGDMDEEREQDECADILNLRFLHESTAPLNVRSSSVLFGVPASLGAVHQTIEFSTARPVLRTRKSTLAARPQHTPNQSNSIRPHRARSILKNPTQIPRLDTTDPECTTANTQCNSAITLNTSGYFSTAFDIPAAPDPSRHVIVPRRRRSSYFEPEPVREEQEAQDEEMLDSGALEPEVEPQASGYITTTTLDILRRASQAASPSKTAPRIEKDFRTI